MGRINRESRIQIRPSKSGDNIFRYGDTVEVGLFFPLSGKDFYIDLNFASLNFTGSRSDRFGVFERSANLTLSIFEGDTVYYKYPQGSNNWEFTSVRDTGQHYPHNAFSLKKYSFNSASGTVRMPLIIDNNMKQGMWTVNASMVTDKPAAISYFPSHYFYIEKAGYPKRLLLIIGSIIIALSVLVFLLIRRLVSAPATKPVPESWILLAEQAEDFLTDHHSDKDLNRKSIADHLRINEQKLVEIYQRVKGRSPVQHLREIRIKKARELLVKSTKSVTEIAFEVGFNDPLIFQRNFKRITGETPSDFRKNMQKS
jgi:AraC-like DNA-binding protein